MKTNSKPLQFSVILVLLSFSMISCTEKKADSKQATREELSQMNRDFAKALNAKDAVAAANLYTEDATLLPPNEAIVSGRENIVKYWQGALDAGASNVSVTTLATGSNGDLGYEIGQFRMDVKSADGKVITEKGKYIELLKRNKEGKWLSTNGIWNSDPVPAN